MLGRCVTRIASAPLVPNKNRSRLSRLRLIFNCPVLLSTTSWKPPSSFLKLSRQNTRGQEEQKFLGGRADRGVFEQVAHDRQAAEQRHLLHVGALLGHDHTADY